jgi:tryptophan synthase alpha chain
MTRITETFAALRQRGRKALIPFITAGDPDRAATVPLMHALAQAGADVIELGVPFSDPMADGPVIQRASERALRHGTSLRDVLRMVSEFRRDNRATPVVLMGYANPIERMGREAFIGAAAAAGVDGVLTVDLPPEEAQDFADALKAAALDPIFLLAPTTPAARIAKIVQLAGGFVYYVSLKGVTGAVHLDLAEVRARLAGIRRHTTLPLGVGFGIGDAATARAVAEFADAVIVGSAVMRQVEAAPDGATAANAVGEFVRKLRQAMDERLAATGS